MNDHLPILRRLGWLLIVVGILDIGVMIYCIIHQQSYSSSLNIFAVVAGVLLLRGHLGTVRVVTWFSAFLLSGFLLCAVVVFPWMQPVDYWLLILREQPFYSMAYIVFVVAFLCMLLWVYRQLRLPAVIAARIAAGDTGRAPRSALLAGGAMAVFLAVMMQLTLHGETAEVAKRLAAEQYGGDYTYFVSSIQWSADRVYARLTAYKEDAVKEVEVEWQR